MTRAQRKAHLLIWLLLAPLAIAGVTLLIVRAPAAPTLSEPAP